MININNVVAEEVVNMCFYPISMTSFKQVSRTQLIIFAKKG